MSGVWRVTFSLSSSVESMEYNRAMLYINGGAVYESQHRTFSESGLVRSTGGLELTREFSQGLNIELMAVSVDGRYDEINFCFEYIPKM